MIAELIAGKRCFVFAGHYGSGKTETAVNFALGLARAGSRTAIVDFDIVNPYFRTSDARAALEAGGIRVVASRYAGSNVDVPALPAEINGLFEDGGLKTVFDVGGDDIGAKAVSRYREEFEASGTAMFFVVNIRRPMTATLPQIERAFADIQASARLKFDAIVNNANMLSATTAADLDEGLDASLELSKALGLPVAFSAVMAGGDAGGGCAGGNGRAGDESKGGRGDEPGGGAGRLGGGREAARCESRLGEVRAGGGAAVGGSLHGGGRLSGGERLPCGDSLAPFAERSARLGIPIFRIGKHIRMDYI
jgi:hypothetical protein